MSENQFAKLRSLSTESPRSSGVELLKSSAALVDFVNAVRLLPLDLKRLLGKIRRKSLIRDYLSKGGVAKLQLGTGPNDIVGWLNTDFVPRHSKIAYLDAKKRFPFDDNTFDFVFHEHLIEHLEFTDGFYMLSECYRVLKPGGRIRVATPNLAEISRLVIDRNDKNCQEYIRLTVDKHISEIGIYEPAFVINNFFWDYGHLFAYDAKVLCGVLEAVGFRKISRCKPGCSEEPALTAIDSHGRLVGDAMNDYETMIFEAIKQD